MADQQDINDLVVQLTDFNKSMNKWMSKNLSAPSGQTGTGAGDAKDAAKSFDASTTKIVAALGVLNSSIRGTAKSEGQKNVELKQFNRAVAKSTQVQEDAIKQSNQTIAAKREYDKNQAARRAREDAESAAAARAARKALGQETEADRIANKKASDEQRDAKEKEKSAAKEAAKQERDDAKERLRESNRQFDESTRSYQTAYREMSGFTSRLSGNGESFSILNDAIGLSIKAVTGLTSGIPILGKTLSAFGEVASDVAKMMIDQFQIGWSAYKDLADIGLSSSFEDMRTTADATGLLFQDINKSLGKYSVDFARFGGTVSAGLKQFNRVSIELTDVREKFAMLGISTTEFAEHQAAFMAQETRQGRAAGMSAQQLAAGTKEYIEQLDTLSKLTGASRRDLQNQRDAAQSETRFAAALDGLSEKAKKSFEDLNIIIAKKGGDSLAQGFRDLASGSVATDAAKQMMIQTDGAAADIVARMRAGSITTAQGFNELQRAMKVMAPAARELGQHIGDASLLTKDYSQLRNMVNAGEITESQMKEIVSARDKNLEGQNEQTKALAGVERSLYDASRSIQGLMTSSDSATIAMDTMATGLEWVTEKLYETAGKALPADLQARKDERKAIAEATAARKKLSELDHDQSGGGLVVGAEFGGMSSDEWKNSAARKWAVENISKKEEAAKSATEKRKSLAGMTPTERMEEQKSKESEKKESGKNTEREKSKFLASEKGYSRGGYTGPGDKNEIAGPVHKGEVVFDQDAVKKIGLSNLVWMQRNKRMIESSDNRTQTELSSKLSTLIDFNRSSRPTRQRNNGNTDALVSSSSLVNATTEINELLKNAGVADANIVTQISDIAKSLNVVNKPDETVPKTEASDLSRQLNSVNSQLKSFNSEMSSSSSGLRDFSEILDDARRELRDMYDITELSQEDEIRIRQNREARLAETKSINAAVDARQKLADFDRREADRKELLDKIQRTSDRKDRSALQTLYDQRYGSASSGTSSAPSGGQSSDTGTAPPITGGQPSRREVSDVDLQGTDPNAVGITEAASDRNPGPASKILDYIGKLESGGNYNKLVGGKVNSDLTNMTLRQVEELQGRMLRSGQHESSAVGKYQIIRGTLRGLVKNGAAKWDDRFDPSTQDKLAMELMNGRGYRKFLAGKMPADQFADNLAKEWAGLPLANGQSYYAGVGSNKAGGDRKSYIESLKARTGGVFKGPDSGYNVELHGKEMVVPVPDGVTKQPLPSAVTQDNTSLEQISSMFQTMNSKFDTMISLLEDNASQNKRMISALQ